MPNPYTFVNWGILGDDKGGGIQLTLDSSPENAKELGKEITDEFFKKVYLKHKKLFDVMLSKDVKYRWTKENLRRDRGWLTNFAYRGVPDKHELDGFRSLNMDRGYGWSEGKWFKSNRISPLICEGWSTIPSWARALILIYTDNLIQWRFNKRLSTRHERTTHHITPRTIEAKILTEHFIYWLRRNNPFTCRNCKGEGTLEPTEIREDRYRTADRLPVPNKYLCGNCDGSGQVY